MGGWTTAGLEGAKRVLFISDCDEPVQIKIRSDHYERQAARGQSPKSNLASDVMPEYIFFSCVLRKNQTIAYNLVSNSYASYMRTKDDPKHPNWFPAWEMDTPLKPGSTIRFPADFQNRPIIGYFKEVLGNTHPTPLEELQRLIKWKPGSIQEKLNQVEQHFCPRKYNPRSQEELEVEAIRLENVYAIAEKLKSGVQTSDLNWKLILTALKPRGQLELAAKLNRKKKRPYRRSLHVVLQLGNLLLDYNYPGLVTIHEIPEKLRNIAQDLTLYSDQIKDHDINDDHDNMRWFDIKDDDIKDDDYLSANGDLINRIAAVIVEWNKSNERYDRVSHNCQHFIDELLKCGLYAETWPAAIEHYLDAIRHNSDNGVPHYYICDTHKRVFFKSHQELDQYVEDNPDMQEDERNLMKTFDRAYMARWISRRRDIKARPKSVFNKRACRLFGPLSSVQPHVPLTAPKIEQINPADLIKFSFGAEFANQKELNEYLLWQKDHTKPHFLTNAEKNTNTWPAKHEIVVFAPKQTISVLRSKPFYRFDWSPPTGEFSGGVERFILTPKQGCSIPSAYDSVIKECEIRSNNDGVEVQFQSSSQRQKVVDICDAYELTRVPWGEYCNPSNTPAATKDEFEAILLEEFNRELLHNFVIDSQTPIGVVDSGLCKDVWKELDPKIQDFRNCQVPDGLPTEKDVNDQDGHGTQMFSIINTLLPDNPKIIAKIADASFWVLSDMAVAIEWALEKGAKFVCVSGGPPTTLTDSFINSLNKIHELARLLDAIVCFSAGNRKNTLWHETFKRMKYTNFHVVGSKDCRGLKEISEYQTANWVEYCDTSNLLKISHGGNFITYCSTKHHKRFEDAIITADGPVLWHQRPHLIANCKLVVMSGTSHANALYTAMLALKGKQSTEQVLHTLISQLQSHKLYRHKPKNNDNNQSFPPPGTSASTAIGPTVSLGEEDAESPADTGPFAATKPTLSSSRDYTEPLNNEPDLSTTAETSSALSASSESFTSDDIAYGSDNTESTTHTTPTHGPLLSMRVQSEPAISTSPALHSSYLKSNSVIPLIAPLSEAHTHNKSGNKQVSKSNIPKSASLGNLHSSMPPPNTARTKPAASRSALSPPPHPKPSSSSHKLPASSSKKSAKPTAKPPAKPAVVRPPWKY